MDPNDQRLEYGQAYVDVTRLTYEKGGQLCQFFKVEGLKRRSARWLGDGELPAFEGKHATFVVQRIGGGRLRFIRQVR